MMLTSLVRRTLHHFVLVTGILALASYWWIYSRPGAPAPIRSDGYSYYVYLPSWFIYQDVTLKRPARACCGGAYPDFTAIRRWPSTGRWLNPHPMGPAILMSPFFIAADALTRATHGSRDGFSIYYQHAAGLAGLSYFLVGLVLLRRILTRHFEPPVALAALATITWGTNLFHYGTYDSVFSHAFSFCLITWLMLLTENWWTDPTPRRSAWLGVVCALIFLSRHTNLLFTLLVPLYGIVDVKTLRARPAALAERWKSLLLAGVVTVAGVLPQLVSYKVATGRWLVSPYSALGAGFTFGSPHLFGVLVSTEKGLLFWSPVLVLSLVGFVVARGWPRSLLVPSTIILAVNVYLVASWFDWQFGGSFSHRAFTDGLSLFAVFLAAFFAWVACQPRIVPYVALVTSLLVALSVAQMIQYWQGVLPIADITWAQYRELFLRFR